MLRDDVKNLFKKLLILHNNKLQRLDDILSRDSESIYNLKSGRFDRLNESIESVAEIIEEIKIIENNILMTNRRVSEIIGIDIKDLNNLIDGSNEKLLVEIKENQNSIYKKIDSVKKQREKLIELMESSQDRIYKDIKEIKDISRFSLKDDQ